MNRPTHIDLAEFERQSRAAIAATFAIADNAIAAGDADPVFIGAQREFTEARIQCALACARADNAGHPHDAVLAAAVSAVGQMLGSIMLTLTDEDRDTVLAWVEEAMTHIVFGSSEREGTPVARVAAPMIVGGNA